MLIPERHHGLPRPSARSGPTQCLSRGTNASSCERRRYALAADLCRPERCRMHRCYTWSWRTRKLLGGLRTCDRLGLAAHNGYELRSVNASWLFDMRSRSDERRDRDARSVTGRQERTEEVNTRRRTLCSTSATTLLRLDNRSEVVLTRAATAAACDARFEVVQGFAFWPTAGDDGLSSCTTPRGRRTHLAPRHQPRLERGAPGRVPRQHADA